MFGRVESSELHAGCGCEDVDCRAEAVVNARRVGYKAHSFALQFAEAIVAKHFDAGLYLGGGGNSQHAGGCCQYCFFHISSSSISFSSSNLVSAEGVFAP